jgi:hypothetical protein
MENMNRVAWPLIIAFIIYPCIPLSSAVDPIFPLHVSLESGTGEVVNSLFSNTRGVTTSNDGKNGNVNLIFVSGDDGF